MSSLLHGLRVGVLGASVGGRIVGTLLERAGASVTVFERSAKGSFVDRGAGLGIASPVMKRMQEQGLVRSDILLRTIDGYTRIVPDPARSKGRVVFHDMLPFNLHLLSWGEMFRNLAVPSDIRFGATCVSVHQSQDSCSLEFSDGSQHSFDAVVGADGYKSMMRKTVVAPDATEVPAGYVLWRGFLTEADASAASVNIDDFEDHFPFIFMPSGGHGVIYPVLRTEGRLLTWGLYINVKDWAATFTDKTGVQHDFTIPSGLMRPELEAEFKALARADLPPLYAAVVDATRDTFMQGVLDVDVQCLAAGRVALVGDAASVARPHTAAGVGKAFETAAALVAALEEAAGGGVEAALKRYSDAQVEQLQQAVRLGKALGRGLVTHLPADVVRWDRAEMERYLKGLVQIDSKFNIYHRPK